MTENNIYIGRAFCTVLANNPEFEDGMRGAFVTFACLTGSIQMAISKVSEELAEIELQVNGLENLYDCRYMTEAPSDYEKSLMERLESYPVQYENVHYFPPDG